MNNKGFTLIELIVVIAVFLVVISIAVGIFISIVFHQRRLLAEQELLNQSSYAIEKISKGLRMAKKEEGENCLVDDGEVYEGYMYLLTRWSNKFQRYMGIKFINQSDNNACMEVFFDEEEYVLKEKKKEDLMPTPLLSDKITINDALLLVNGQNEESYRGVSEEDISQPRVTIMLDLKIGKGENVVAKKFQTTVSQRNLNVK